MQLPERARFSPTSTKSKVEHPPLEETKGHKFEEVKFANNFDSAAENLKTFSANISKRSKVLKTPNSMYDQNIRISRGEHTGLECLRECSV